MKTILPYLSIPFIAALFIQCNSPVIKSVATNEFGFDADSGFILKPQAEQLLHKIYPDSTGLTFDLKDNDSIGKYYKTSWGNIYSCIGIPETATHIVCEITPKGLIAKSGLFYSGTSHCCWSNLYEGFQKHGKYFSIKTCGTGSGFCSSELFIFDRLKSQEEQNSILQFAWQSFCSGGACNLYSDMKIKNDIVYMHYTLEKGEQDDEGEFKIRETKYFDIHYTKKESKWISPDTIKLNDFRY